MPESLQEQLWEIIDKLHILINNPQEECTMWWVEVNNAIKELNNVWSNPKEKP